MTTHSFVVVPVLALSVAAAVLIPHNEQTESDHRAEQHDTQRRTELLRPLLQAYRENRLNEISDPSLTELLPLADRRTEREDGSFLYSFDKCGWISEEGECLFYLVVDEAKACPVIVDGEMICPEW